MIKLAVSSLVFLADRLTAVVRKAFGGPGPRRSVILYYHGISSSEKAGFDRQMAALAKHSQPVTCDGVGLGGGGSYAGVTFDDAFVSILENALPVLERENIPAAVFVPTGYIGQKPGWIKRPDLLARAEMIMNRQQLRSLADHPLITLGSHTVTHPRLPSLSDEDVRKEMEDSRNSLESITGKPVRLFSFPHGAFGERELNLARSLGYRCVFGIKPALAHKTPEEFLTGRVAADPSDWPVEFRLKLAGAYRWAAF